MSAVPRVAERKRAHAVREPEPNASEAECAAMPKQPLKLSARVPIACPSVQLQL
jgi:hypothetical protein